MAHPKGPLGQRLAEARASLYEDTPTASPDEMLEALLKQAYHGASLSPADKIHAILEGSHPHFVQLVRNFSIQLIAHRKLSQLDKVIVDPAIHPADTRWVPNTRRLTENTIQQGVADDLEAVIPNGHQDVRDEVLAVFGTFHR